MAQPTTIQINGESLPNHDDAASLAVAGKRKRDSADEGNEANGDAQVNSKPLLPSKAEDQKELVKSCFDVLKGYVLDYAMDALMPSLLPSTSIRAHSAFVANHRPVSTSTLLFSNDLYLIAPRRKSPKLSAKSLLNLHLALPIRSPPEVTRACKRLKMTL
jgi:hypothetical protein